MMESHQPETPAQIYTITRLTQEIKKTLETNFYEIWLTGEISNFHAHSSGHFYFTLKDSKSQISAVMFRGSNRFLKFNLENGLEILAKAKVTVYEARGNYQVIIEYIEPKGLGSLQLAYEQLRQRLEKAGLFSLEHKKELPFLPHTVGIITSPTGAAIRDLVQVLHRRCPRTNILLYPVNVQGESAAPQIAQAIEEMNQISENLNQNGINTKIDTLIIGRGGGSLEDLWAFNTEIVAQAIFDSKIPVISAVGHESDFCIADFVADLRAPTPSAAAELAVPVQKELEILIKEKTTQLCNRFEQQIRTKKQELLYLKSHLKHPQQNIEERSQYLDDLKSNLFKTLQTSLLNKRIHFNHLIEKLHVLSPLATLKRGYAMVSLEKKSQSYQGKLHLISSVTQLKNGDNIKIEMQDGHVTAKVNDTKV